MSERNSKDASVKQKASASYPNINDSWGYVYDLNCELPHFYLNDDKGTFWLTRKGRLYRKNNAPFFDHVLNHKLFKIKLNEEGKIDLTITIEPVDEESEIYVYGSLLTKKTQIKNGQCEIVSKKYNLHLKFEAFLDLTNYPELVRVGDNYRFINLLGKGGFAYVYKGYNIAKEDSCAIKTARFVHLDPELTREENLLSQLSHKNIIRVLGWIEVQNDQFLIMEFLGGGSLEYRIKSLGPISETFAKRIFNQLFLAFQYMHAKKIIHRDVKPQNIMLTRPDDATCVAKVIDFGLACFTTEEDEMRYIVGSYEYMSPEILTKKLKTPKAPYTEKVDVWGLGICLFFAFCNCLPFPFEDDLKVYRKMVMHGKENYNFLESYTLLTKPTRLIIESCLQINERKRPNLAALVKNPWSNGGESSINPLKL